MTELQENEHKSTSYINWFRDHYPIYNKGEHKKLTGVAGIYMIFTETRLVYIGTSTNLYAALHAVFGASGTNSIQYNFLYDQLQYFSYIEFNPYDRRISEDIKRSLLERFRPVLNYAQNEFSWYDKEMKEYIKRELKPLEEAKAEAQQLREEIEKLKEQNNNLENQIQQIRNITMHVKA
jgi:hypothetical protein